MHAMKRDEYATAGCLHEVYAGERMYIMQAGKRAVTLCPDCMEDVFDGMRLEDKAALLGCSWEYIT